MDAILYISITVCFCMTLMLTAAFWNWAMVATARFLPVKIITDRDKIRKFAEATSPVIRFVDPLIGEKVMCAVIGL